MVGATGLLTLLLTMLAAGALQTRRQAQRVETAWEAVLEDQQQPLLKRRLQTAEQRLRQQMQLAGTSSAAPATLVKTRASTGAQRLRRPTQPRQKAALRWQQRRAEKVVPGVNFPVKRAVPGERRRRPPILPCHTAVQRQRRQWRLAAPVGMVFSSTWAAALGAAASEARRRRPPILPCHTVAWRQRRQPRLVALAGPPQIWSGALGAAAPGGRPTRRPMQIR